MSSFFGQQNGQEGQVWDNLAPAPPPNPFDVWANAGGGSAPTDAAQAYLQGGHPGGNSTVDTWGQMSPPSYPFSQLTTTIRAPTPIHRRTTVWRTQSQWTFLT